jgi:2-oxoglutarate ferredoxin oxidoreductase subunit alpha
LPTISRHRYRRHRRRNSGKLAVVGWGSTFGAINQAVGRCVKDGLSVSHIHIRHVWPFPANLEELLSKFDRIIVPEMNNGQMVNVLRAKFLVDAESITQITGQPFKVSTLEREIRSRLEG